MVQEMKMDVNGLQSQIDYMLNVVDKCRANKMTGRLSTSLADSVASTIERHDKLRANIDDTLSKIERAQSNVDDFEVSLVAGDSPSMSAMINSHKKTTVKSTTLTAVMLLSTISLHFSTLSMLDIPLVA